MCFTNFGSMIRDREPGPGLKRVLGFLGSAIPRSYSYRRDQNATVTWRGRISSLNLSSRLQQPQHEVTGEDVQLLL